MRHFRARVAGVKHLNPDGTDRQKIIARCVNGELLDLMPEPENSLDADAIKVCRKNGQQLGCIRGSLAAKITGLGERGYRCAAYIHHIYGGMLGRPTRGVCIEVFVTDSATPPEELRARVKKTP